MLPDCIFLDRDGTINVDKSYIHQWSDFEMIPGSLKALQVLTQKNIPIYIVTNQAGIAKGLFTEADFQKLTQKMLAYFSQEGIRITDVLHCPHHPQGSVKKYAIDCLCRKPGTKLVEDLVVREKLALERSVMIGDKQIDVDLGKKLGMTTYLVETGYGLHFKKTTNADFVVADLKAAVDHLLS
jgi:histidinol-phosphate phosphatase family protein